MHDFREKVINLSGTVIGKGILSRVISVSVTLSFVLVVVVCSLGYEEITLVSAVVEFTE